MEKKFFNFVIVALSIIVFCSCNNGIPDAYIGKWDMTNDKDSPVQKTIVLKKDNVFIETWTVYDENGDLFGELNIQGKYDRRATEGYHWALCLIYDLDSLDDPNDILESLEIEEYFEEENNKYKDHDKRKEIYGLQNVHASDSYISFDGGEWNRIE